VTNVLPLNNSNILHRSRLHDFGITGRVVQFLFSAKCEEEYTQVCEWSPWKSTNVPTEATNGEFEKMENLMHLPGMCTYQFGIECRPVNSSNASKKQTVTCDTKNGLICHNAQVSTLGD